MIENGLFAFIAILGVCLGVWGVRRKNRLMVIFGGSLFLLVGAYFIVVLILVQGIK